MLRTGIGGGKTTMKDEWAEVADCRLMNVDFTGKT